MVCRQVLVNLALPIRNKVFEAYKTGDLKLFDKYVDLFLNIASDVDKIVSTQNEFSFDAVKLPVIEKFEFLNKIDKIMAQSYFKKYPPDPHRFFQTGKFRRKYFKARKQSL